MTRITPELKQLADSCGVMTSYEDVYKQRQDASVESLLAVLETLGVGVSSLDDVPQALAAQQLARNQRGVEPVVVAWDGAPLEFDVTLPVRHGASTVHCTIELEDQSESMSQQFDLTRIAPRPSSCGRFATRRLRMARGVGSGYHRLRLEGVEVAGTDGAQSVPAALIISAPRCTYTHQAAAQRDWGCFLPLYAMRSQRNWGAGDFTDLQQLAEWTASLGGNFVGTLPLLAAFLDEPYEPSPYAPASRLAWNEFYIDVARVAELHACPPAKQLMQSADFCAELARLRQSELVEYRELMALKRRVLELLAANFFQHKPAARLAQFELFLRTHQHVEDYARFRATYELRGAPWQDWPAALRDGELAAGDFEQQAERYHQYVQWVAHEQLHQLASSTSGGLYLDLPLGVRSDGYDLWRWKEYYATNASAGSPPDAMWTRGQDWCFPPLHPSALRRDGYAHVRHYLQHHMRLAGLLRIDHVMQLHRLYWIPRGLPTDRGVYVKYHSDEFFAILAIESHRHQTALVGENLGTVPPEVDRAMDRHNLKQMYVVQYEVAEGDDDRSKHAPGPAAGDTAQDAPAQGQTAGGATAGGTQAETAAVASSDVPSGAMASLNTHDMPTFAAWWQGKDIPFRQQLGLIGQRDACRERNRLGTTKAQLTTWLRRQGWLRESEAGDRKILLALLRFLAASPAGAVLVNLEDLWLETQPQNVPGTGPELPNWMCKSAMAFDEFKQDDGIVSVLRAVDAERRKAGGE